MTWIGLWSDSATEPHAGSLQRHLGVDLSVATVATAIVASVLALMRTRWLVSSVLLLIAGLAGLLIRAELLVRGGSKLASRLGVTPHRDWPDRGVNRHEHA
jgi:hypothetical protein